MNNTDRLRKKKFTCTLFDDDFYDGDYSIAEFLQSNEEVMEFSNEETPKRYAIFLNSIGYEATAVGNELHRN